MALVVWVFLTTKDSEVVMFEVIDTANGHNPTFVCPIATPGILTFANVIPYEGARLRQSGPSYPKLSWFKD